MQHAAPAPAAKSKHNLFGAQLHSRLCFRKSQDALVVLLDKYDVAVLVRTKANSIRCRRPAAVTQKMMQDTNSFVDKTFALLEAGIDNADRLFALMLQAEKNFDEAKTDSD